MKGLDTGKDKVKKICEELRQETLDPALKEAQQLIENARREAERILEEARHHAEKIKRSAEEERVRQKKIFESSLQQAAKQSLELLRQQIEERFFNQELGRYVTEKLQEPKVIADLITAVINALEKEGTTADLSVIIPATIPARTINALLAKEILAKLKEKSVLVGTFAGGVEVKLHQQKMTLDVSDEAVKELLAGFARKDFRELFFA